MSFDFSDLFKEQLATEKPFTAGNINSILHMMSYNKTPREIMTESKKLKTKIGKRRLLYYVTHANLDGTASKQEMVKVWEDEFSELQSKLSNYNFMGYKGIIPEFANKDIK